MTTPDTYQAIAAVELERHIAADARQALLDELASTYASMRVALHEDNEPRFAQLRDHAYQLDEQLGY